MLFGLPESDRPNAPEDTKGNDGHGQGVVLLVLVGVMLDSPHLHKAIFLLF